MRDVEIETIMNQIREEAQQKEAVFSQQEEERLAEEERIRQEAEAAVANRPNEEAEVFDYLNTHYELADSYDMGSGRGAWRGRLIQRLVHCVLHPLRSEQSVYNAQSVHGMNLLREHDEKMEQEIAALHRQNEELKQVVAILAAKLEVQRQLLEHLQK